MGPCPREVVEATVRAWYDLESAPQAMGYGAGSTLAQAEEVRQQGAELLGCGREDIAITRSTTDGINAVAQGLGLRPGDRVLITDQEHEGGMSGWQFLAARADVGLDVVSLPPSGNDNQMVLDGFAAAITPQTRVICVSHVLSSTGLRMPIADISALARSRGIVCVVDGAQSAGCIEVDVKSLGCHAYATSGHKWLMGPKGNEGLQELDAATVVSAPPGPLATPLVTFAIPPEIDSRDLTARLLNTHRIQVKMVPKRWLNGIRLSPHVFNTPEEVDNLLAVLQVELT